MDEEFTTMAYPSVQENLKLPTEDEVRLEEPASSAGTLSSLQNMDKDLSFTNQFLAEKEQTMEYMQTQEIDRKINETVKEAINASVKYAIRAPLHARFKDLPTSDMKEILLQRMLEENYDKGHKDHKMAYDALQKSILCDDLEQFDTDKAEKLKQMKKKHDSLKTPHRSPPPPPPPPPPSGPSVASSTVGAFKSAQDPPFHHHRLQQSIKPVSSIPKELHMDNDTTTDEHAYSSGGEDIRHDHIPIVNLRQNWWKPLTEDRLATPEPTWSIPSSDLSIPTNN
ncbi:hypothetical protein Tco_1052958 [Tanacetum coccineum]